MTYMPETNLSDLSDRSISSQPTTAEKLKTLAKESSQRAQRISSILKQAFSETREEFQAGRTVISPIAKEVTAEAVSTFKSKSQQAAEVVNQAWQEEDSTPDFTERLINVLKSVASTTKAKLFPQIKVQTQKQASRLDDLLGDRYGEQYITFKDRFGQVYAWINTSKVAASSVATEDITDVPSQTATVIEVDSKVIN
ncbi:hypothetical protein S7335_1819 [Synechococcus sp. PCC 7335]|uniref:hypothetical protein n=1 Tax=Synechococcus sp. (strain ATCC 29403 / PCC 7335) TaxID=91464 RepID=UPI00017EE80C|nr:hypothetical protein [Synechococcus sp. PCC 7335]EDX84122.1 hypothetical protein S7335_1819 [Synechococcus sp. PCC 7335]